VSVRILTALLLTAGCAGCGLNVQSPDLFLLTRTGAGRTLTLLVNDAGTISCDHGKARPLADPMLLQARDLASTLDDDAKAHLTLPQGPRSVYRFTIALQNGTVAFPDTAAAAHHELSQAELFALQAAGSACGSGGGSG
jgi:hypothetical protein